MAYTWKNYDQVIDSRVTALKYPWLHVGFYKHADERRSFCVMWSREAHGPGYRGALTISWRWPRLVWCPMRPCQLDGITATDWTGRKRELVCIDYDLTIYLRSPGGFDRDWSARCRYCHGMRGISYYDPEYGEYVEECPGCRRD